MTTAPRWTLGLDLGTKSLGYAAIAYDANGIPEDILYSGSVIHDGGQDRQQSYKANAGAARRARNRYKQLRTNRRAMDSLLKEKGMPHGNDIVERAANDLRVHDIFEVRALLATKKIEDPSTQSLAVAAVIRHMQSRRGYRNSWVSEEFVLTDAREGYSSQYHQLHARCGEVCGGELSEDLTPAQLFVTARRVSPLYSTKVLSVVARNALKKVARSQEEASKDPRKPVYTLDDVLAAKGSPVSPDDIPKVLEDIERKLLHQSLRRSDLIRELFAIAAVQELDPEFVASAASLIIFNVHPSTGMEERVKLDDLPATGVRSPRALKSSLVFQQFRITAQVATLRHVGGSSLSHSEQDAARTFLMGWSDTDERPTWGDVAAAAGVKRFAKSDNLSRPDINTTALRILSKGGPLKEFWTAPSTTDAHRSILVGILAGVAAPDSANAAASHVQAWVDTLDEKVIAGFDTLKFEPGRAAHSEQTMLLLTAFMHDPANPVNDLHTARTSVFGVSDTWRPSPSPLGTPVGNPTVDSNIKLVKRILDTLVSRIGCEPDRVVIESARDIVNSDSTRKEATAASKSRSKDKDKALTSALEKYDVAGVFDSTTIGVRKSDAMRLLLLHEQHGACLYCGGGITLPDLEVDHIVPVSHGGSNARINLAATCRPCNGSKSNTSFAEWATDDVRKGTAARIAKMIVTNAKSAVSRKKWVNKYTSQLTATECERPLESVSWAAVEVRDQLEGALSPSPTVSRVLLVPGRITSDVRHLGGIDTANKPILLRYPGYTPKGKSRLDRRHHAIDAAVLTAIRQSTITVVSERNLLREQARLASGGGALPNVTWDDDGVEVSGRWDAYNGRSRDRFAFAQTRNALYALRNFLVDAVAEDRIPVTRAIKWTPSTAKIHNDTVTKFPKHRLGDAIPSAVIDRASTSALWTALTRLPDYTERDGLPENRNRQITVRGVRIGAEDTVGFFPGTGGALPVRGGYAEAQGIHHFRVLEVPSAPNKKGVVKTAIHLVRVYAFDAARLHQTGKDVFTTPLAESTLSMRDAGVKARTAFHGASSWKVITPGDELVLTPDQCASGSQYVKAVHTLFPDMEEYRFIVTGFDKTSASVSPSLLSDEDSGKAFPDDDAGKGATGRQAVLGARTLGGVRVSRRNLIGEERTTGAYVLRSGVL